jgi:hypothetical protein
MAKITHRRILGTYLAVVGLTATTLGGYVACGAQTYRVRVDDDMGSPNAAGHAASSNLAGVHSSKGWSNRLPIHFKSAASMTPEMVEQLKGAMKTWELAVGKPLFAYDGSDHREGKSFPELYAPLSDFVNGHYLDLTWAASTRKGKSVLATCIWENDGRDARYIAKADIRYNSESYVFGDTLTEYSQGERIIVDMESLALHELGHLLGLSHISSDDDRYSVMNPALFIGEGMITRKLSRGDLERIRSIYGAGNEQQAETLEYADDL